MVAYPEHLLMVGAGNMAGQMLNRWLSQGLDPVQVQVVRPSGKPVAPGVVVRTDMPAQFAPGTMVMLGMKPYQLNDVAPYISAAASADTMLVSILAGVAMASLRETFATINNIVRVMPNTPVGVGQGVSALYADAATSESTCATVARLMAPLGLVEWIADEGDFNLVTALSGCGPAYFFRFIDALGNAANSLGLPRDQAQRLALATVQGAATLAASAHEAPGILADRVASPGGMTRQGMNVLDADNRLVDLLTDTLRAARDRGEEMAREAK